MTLTFITTVQLQTDLRPGTCCREEQSYLYLMEIVTALCCFSVNYNVRLQLICSEKLRNVP